MTIGIYANGNDTIGAGHALRCLAVAQQLQERNSPVEWLAFSMSDRLRNRIEQEGMSVTIHDDVSLRSPARDIADFIRHHSITAILLDDYELSAAVFESIAGSGCRTCVIDDTGLHNNRFLDIVVNPNIDADSIAYDLCRDDASILRGLDYALIRNEFVSIDEPANKRMPPANVLVTLGGADNADMIGRVAEMAAAIFPDAAITVLGDGPMNSGGAAVDATVRWRGHANNMAEALGHADFVISAAGSTTWEICYVGLPAILLIIADNQAGLANRLAEDGLASVIDCRSGIDADALRLTLSAIKNDGKPELERAAKRRRLVDGRGARRIADRIMSLAGNTRH